MKKTTFKTLPGYIEIRVDREIIGRLCLSRLYMGIREGEKTISELESEITEEIHERVKLELMGNILPELSYEEREKAIEYLMDNYRDDGLLDPEEYYQVTLGGYNKKTSGMTIKIKPL